MKILIVGFNVQADVFPLGAAYLKTYARKYHPDVEIEIKEFSFGSRYNYETNKNTELQALSYILLSKPDVVAFSSYIWSGEMVKDFARAVKQISPEIKTVIGGVEASSDILTKDVDFIITGEGEIAFKELIDHLKGTRNLDEVHNVVTSGRKNPIIIVENLDELPFPYEIELKKEYAAVRLETARGCIFSCNFCHYAQPKLRHFSVDYLKRNIPYLFEHYDFKNLTILDANFNTNKERMLAILDILEQEFTKKKIKLKVHVELRPELIDERLAEAMSRFSFSLAVELGLQSTDKEVLAFANRPTDLKKVEEALLHLERYRINYKIDLMYGLPKDTFFKFLHSMQFVINNAVSQNKVVAHHFMQLNNTAFADAPGISRITPEHSSMVLKTDRQDVLDLYKTKLFVDMVNEELKLLK
ncbi:hypothetical protein COV20_01825 [Candidatus Woesearchaeota archaeon CG10_big_fil_rev_8_21_14_0_10_45_16]|nr:MAG: hypothetical protein COV20_01825 [Candidatus Woesearchaeota archaeon CG10_big_fil_rev_8_21_14_0_10_45_16]